MQDTTPTAPLQIDADTVARLLSMRSAINLMREAFLSLSANKAVCPTRLSLPVAEQNASSLIMPCYLPGSGYFGVKTANVFPNNSSRGLPAIHSIYHLYSAESGLLLMTMDGAALTKLRTGAASGLASELLANRHSSILAIFGTGVQAESQIEAVCSVRDIREILVFSRHESTAKSFAGRMSSKCHAPIRAAKDPTELRHADVICTATSSTKALFDASDVKPGAHINAVGAYRPDMCEVPADLIESCILIVDQCEAAMEEAGDIIQPFRAGRINKGRIYAELGQLLDRKTDVRKRADDISVFKSVGSAVQDFVCAKHLYEQAL